MDHSFTRFSGALLLTAAMLSGCGKASKPLEPDPPAVTPVSSVALEPEPLPPPPAPAPSPAPETNTGVVLKVRWPVGSRYLYRMDLDQHSTNQMPHAPQSTREEVTVGVTYALSVLQEAADGSRELELEFLAHDTEIKIDGEAVFTFDSGITNESQRVPSPFRKVVGSKVRLQVDESAKVQRVIGLDAWAKDVAGDTAGPAGQLLVQQFNEGFFQQTADFGRGLPEHPVAAGDHWPYRTEMPAGSLGKIVLDSRITLQGWQTLDQQCLAILEAKGTLQGIPASDTGSIGTLRLESGTVTGISYFDADLGALIESAVEQVMQLKADVPAPPDSNAAPGQFTSHTQQKVVVKLVEHTAKAP